ncbi:MICOS complex subunit MIC27 isoform X2 [Neocloeon triangulifer]|uniref:MICOS complex subunit MIC27 isoform X2 n=1 Tax=Neocloeon triangulifer TaxID=2078957 RepID=UPI00286FA310|nr:MICOS complex subunit MIC27 isoform X2 [Neocloeon triangulifer]
MIMAEKNPFAGPIRRTEIPIYRDEVDRFRQETLKVQEEKDEPTLIRQLLSESLSTCRGEVVNLYEKLSPDLTQFKDKIDTGVAHASGTLEYLRQEENDIPRVGAVAMAGMAGLIFGLRGGFFRKIFYMSTASTGMAALCYPNQAIEISKDLVVNSKKYALIGYNFVKGDSVEKTGPSPVKIVVKPPEAPKLTMKASVIKGDPGMSNPEDKDLYTTRS